MYSIPVTSKAGKGQVPDTPSCCRLGAIIPCPIVRPIHRPLSDICKSRHATAPHLYIHVPWLRRSYSTSSSLVRWCLGVMFDLWNIELASLINTCNIRCGHSIRNINCLTTHLTGKWRSESHFIAWSWPRRMSTSRATFYYMHSRLFLRQRTTLLRGPDIQVQQHASFRMPTGCEEILLCVAGKANLHSIRFLRNS